MTRALVLAVAALAAVAAVDALRGDPPEAARPTQRSEDVSTARLVRAPLLPYVADGRFLRERVLYAGREYLSAEVIEEAFPVAVEGPLHISRLTAAPDGTIVLGVYRFPYEGEARGAVQVWRQRRLVTAFPVPSGYFGGGLGVSRDARYVATFAHDGELTGVFDSRGRPLARLPDSFLYVS